MIHLITKLVRSSRPLLAASSMLGILVVVAMLAALPPATMWARTALSFDDGRTGRDSGPVVMPIDLLKDVLIAEDSNAKRENRVGKRVALQAGHWRYWESPAPFNTQTGTSAAGKNEPDVTLDIAQRTAQILEGMGYTVEILPAWFPTEYTAEAVVAIHADGAERTEARGYFAERYGGSAVPEVDDNFMAVMNEEYGKATGLPFVYRTTRDSRYYYGFTRIQPKTPAILLETGFLTNAEDREIIVKDPNRAARGLANGIDKFLVQ